MYRERGAGGSKSEVVVGPVDRKRINDALDKQLERSSPSTSRTTINGKDMSVLLGKHPADHQRDSRSASLSKNHASDGKIRIHASDKHKYLSFYLEVFALLFIFVSLSQI